MSPDVRLDTTLRSLEDCVHELGDYLETKGILRSGSLGPTRPHTPLTLIRGERAH